MNIPANKRRLFWSSLVMTTIALHLAAGEPAPAEGEWTALVERGAAVEIMAAADRLEQRWNDQLEPLEYVRAVIPLCVALREAQELTPDLAQVLGEVARRLAQKEVGELLPGKQRLMIELVNTPRGFGALPPDAARRYRMVVAHVLAILVRQARDTGFFLGQHSPAGIHHDVTKPTEDDRRVVLAGQRLLNMLPRSHASFLVDWYGRAPIDLEEALEMALLFGQEPDATSTVMMRLRKPMAGRDLPVPEQEKPSDEEFLALVVKELNQIAQGNFDSQQKHEMVQKLTVRVLTNQSPIMSLSATLCGEALLEGELVGVQDDEKAKHIWERRRQRDVRLVIGILSACRRDRLPLSDRQSLEQGVVLPEELKSLGTALDEIDPLKIRDPEVRELYRRLMVEQERRERLSDKQASIDAVLAELPIKLEEYLVMAYSRPPLRYEELVEFMACAGLENEVRRRVLSAIVEITGDPPAAHLLTGWGTEIQPRF